MLALLMGPEALGYVMLVLACDLIVFGSMIVIVITGSGQGASPVQVLRKTLLGGAERLTFDVQLH